MTVLLRTEGKIGISGLLQIILGVIPWSFSSLELVNQVVDFCAWCWETQWKHISFQFELIVTRLFVHIKNESVSQLQTSSGMINDELVRWFVSCNIIRCQNCEEVQAWAAAIKCCQRVWVASLFFLWSNCLQCLFCCNKSLIEYSKKSLLISCWKVLSRLS